MHPFFRQPATTAPLAGYAIDLPYTNQTQATITGLAGSIPAVSCRLRLKVDPLLQTGFTDGAFFSIQKSGVSVPLTLCASWITTGAATVTIQTSVQNTVTPTFNGPTFTLAQNSLPSAGTYVILYAYYDSGDSGAGAGVYLANDYLNTVYGSATVALSVVGGTGTLAGANALQIAGPLANGNTNVIIDGIELQSAQIPNYGNPPAGTAPGTRLGYWNFNGQSLVEAHGGPSFVSSGANPSYTSLVSNW